MTQEVQTTGFSGGSAVASLQNLQAGLVNVQAVALKPAGGLPLLRLLRSGEWVYGQTNIAPEEGSLWAFNPFSLEHGYISWTDYPAEDRRKNEIVGEVMVPMTEPIPSRSSLPETEWSWSTQVGVQAKCLTGQDTGEEVSYKPTSVGGRNALAAIAKAIQMRLDTPSGQAGFVVPVCRLDVDSYQHNKYGKTYVPDLPIVGWVDMNGKYENEADAKAAPAEATPEANPEAGERPQVRRRPSR